MLYSILIYEPEAVVEALSKEENEARLEKHRAIQKALSEGKRLGPVAKLMPTSSAATVRSKGQKALVLDGPFAESKEQLVGFYCFEADSLQDALAIAGQFPCETGAIEVRPIEWFYPGDQVES